MKRAALLLAFELFAISLLAAEPQVFIPPTSSPTAADEVLADYFRNEAMMISERCLAEIQSADDWKKHQDEYRAQLQEMLGLSPWPARTDLKPVVTGTLEQEEFTVEKLHFQPVPKVYITAALYLPKKRDHPLPAVLLESGHARFITNNVSYGNKAVYQNLGAWFARNGYVCLNVDTLQLGEIRGDHTGTRDLGQWWWNSRGYTPAGVEAWTGIRALDYLCSRPEVDANRIGITGHSGGGAYSWTVGALDDRVKAAAPVAGLTDLQNQVFDNIVDSHCDCNFFINTYRWDFPQLAALHAPRPLLLGGTDKDRLFHLSGMNRMQQHLRRLYALLGETNKFGYVITPGPHEWNTEGQVAVLHWFNRYLKGEDTPIENAAKRFFMPEELRVFKELPADAINTNIQTTFVPAAKPFVSADGKPNREALLTTLREKVFAGWPAEDVPLNAKLAFSETRGELKLSAWDFTSQHDVRLRLYFLESAAGKPVESVALHVLDETSWFSWLGGVRALFDAPLAEELRDTTNSPSLDPGALRKSQAELAQKPVALAFIAPRGVGLTAWSGGDKRLTQIRRRFMLVGQTLAGMQVWDIRRAVQMVHYVREGDRAKVELHAEGAMSTQAHLATLFEPSVRKLDAGPAANPNAVDYLNFSRLLDWQAVGELNANLNN
jgi:dienelactone hydrolase